MTPAVSLMGLWRLKLNNPRCWLELNPKTWSGTKRGSKRTIKKIIHIYIRPKLTQTQVLNSACDWTSRHRRSELIVSNRCHGAMMYWKFVGQKHCALICGSLQSTYFYGYTQWPLVWSTNVTSGRILQVFAEPQRANNDSHAQVDIRSYGDALFVLRDLGLGNPMGFCVKKLPNFQTQITLSWLMLVIFMYNICIICI